jgi:DNA phosphorothioation-dependent restriction protein DptG
VEVTVSEGKKARIRVRTVNGSYVGDFLIPPMRNRVSDVLNEEQRLFISLTDVVINDKERVDFVSLNKNLIESITQL